MTEHNSIENASKPWWAKFPLWPLAALLLTVLALYPSLQNDWVNWDDQAYVTQNHLVQQQSWENFQAIWTTPEQVGLYHPLTILSLAADHQIWGNQAFGYHLSSLLLHLLNVLLVFVFVRRLCRRDVAAFVAALLFGLHPMHLESVAWISARKDLLYTAFVLLSLISYLRYARADARTGYLAWGLSLVLMLLALLSKGMAFVLPGFLLLVDYWEGRKLKSGLLIEKLPFFALSILGMWIALGGQTSSRSMQESSEFPLYQTVFFGTHNSLLYMIKAIVPFKLAAFHPFPEQPQGGLSWIFYLSALPFLLGIYGLYRAAFSHRWLFFGLTFFLVSIGPVLQILPFGRALHAERYTYLAFVGLFFVVGWMLDRVWNGGTEDSRKGQMKISPAGRKIILAAAGIWVLVLGGITHVQSGVWENGNTLWSNVIEKYPDHFQSYAYRGQYLLDENQDEAAWADIQKCLEIHPTFSDCHYNAGRLHEKRGDWQAAKAAYDQAIKADSAASKAMLNRAMLKAQRFGDLRAAEEDLGNAIAAEPDYALAYLNRGVIHENLRQDKLALEDYQMAIQLEPWNAVFYRYLGVYYYARQRLDEAMQQYDEAIRLKPDYANAWYLRSKVWRDRGIRAQALKDVMEAKRLGYELPAGYLQSIEALPAR